MFSVFPCSDTSWLKWAGSSQTFCMMTSWWFESHGLEKGRRSPAQCLIRERIIKASPGANHHLVAPSVKWASHQGCMLPEWLLHTLRLIQALIFFFSCWLWKCTQGYHSKCTKDFRDADILNLPHFVYCNVTIFPLCFFINIGLVKEI